MYEKEGNFDFILNTCFIPTLYGYKAYISHLAHRNCYASWETKETKLQYNQSVPQLKGINNSDCGMIELLYNSSQCYA
jgi:hypothetical protein